MKKLLPLCLILALGACFPDKDTPNSPAPTPGSILVLNEGNFQWGNASITGYDLKAGTASDGDVFSSANGRPLGDVLQSALLIDNNYWLVINNSGKIEVVDQTTFKSQKTLSLLGSPRHLCQVSPDEVALTDLYSDSLSFLNIHSGAINSKVHIEGWMEQMCLVKDRLWVTNPNSRKIYQVSPDTKQVTDSLPVGFGSFSVYADKAERLWIATRGNKDLGIPSMIHCLDPVSKSFLFSEEIGIEIIQDFFMDDQDRVYYLFENKLFRFDAQSPAIPSTPLYEGSAGNLYAVEYHAGKIFLSDAIDFIQRGNVLVLDDSGKLLDMFQAGRIPNGFLFIP
ncbi:MAG: DUF5074 domain-containing protein [Bacteroidia bacterium]